MFSSGVHHSTVIRSSILYNLTSGVGGLLLLKILLSGLDFYYWNTDLGFEGCVLIMPGGNLLISSATTEEVFPWHKKCFVVFV